MRQNTAGNHRLTDQSGNGVICPKQKYAMHCYLLPWRHIVSHTLSGKRQERDNHIFFSQDEHSHCLIRQGSPAVTLFWRRGNQASVSSHNEPPNANLTIKWNKPRAQGLPHAGTTIRPESVSPSTVYICELKNCVPIILWMPHSIKVPS